MTAGSGDTVITLRDEDCLGRRQTRETYLHPHDPTLVLKVQTVFMHRKKHWYDLPVTVKPSFQRELEGYADLLCRLGRHAPFLSRVHGLEQTNKGLAVLAENVTVGAVSHVILRDLLKHRVAHDFSQDDVAWARAEYAKITDVMLGLGIYNQCQRPENVMLCRLRDGSLRLRMYDFKTLAYRTLIHPRFIPGARYRLQRNVVESTLKAFNAWRPTADVVPPVKGN